jgi:hypothetical protein
VTTIAGQRSSGYANGCSLEANFNEPKQIAIDELDNIFVADSSNHCIRKVDNAGENLVMRFLEVF